jgi:flagellin-like hook-associated protein FlgL
VLSAQATLGTSLAEIQSVQTQTSTLSIRDHAISTCNRRTMPQVLANYSEGLTALQAAQLAFAKVQGLTLFNDIQP